MRAGDEHQGRARLTLSKHTHLPECGLPGIPNIPAQGSDAAAPLPAAEAEQALRRIIALCSYVLNERDKMDEVMSAHHCAFERPDSAWQVSGSLGR